MVKGEEDENSIWFTRINIPHVNEFVTGSPNGRIISTGHKDLTSGEHPYSHYLQSGVQG